MTATGHAVIGTVIAARIGNPLLAIPIALLSHLAADASPHWDTGTNWRKKSWKYTFIQSFIDVCISIILPFILTIWLFPATNLGYLYLIVFCAQFFDWATAPYFFFKMKFPPFTWANAIQMPVDNRLDKPWGIIVQASILITLVVVAKLTY